MQQVLSVNTTERGAINGSENLLVLSEVLTSSKRYACNSKICLFSKLYLYKVVMNDEATAEIQVCFKSACCREENKVFVLALMSGC